MYDVLIASVASASATFTRSYNKDSNYCSIPLPRHGGVV